MGCSVGCCDAWGCMGVHVRVLGVVHGQVFVGMLGWVQGRLLMRVIWRLHERMFERLLIRVHDWKDARGRPTIFVCRQLKPL